MRRVYYGSRKEYKKRKRRHRRDWHRSEFNNPFFSKSRAINLKPYLYFLLFSAIIAASVYFFLIFDYWKINSVVIETQNQTYRDKVQKIIDDALNSKVIKVLDGANYFLFNPQNIKTEIESELLVENLEIQKKMPNKIVVNFNEIKPSYIWIQGEKFYDVDENGLALNEIISVQQKIDGDNEDANNGDKNEFNLEKIKKFLQNSDVDLKLPIIYNESGSVVKSREFAASKDVLNIINDLNLKIAQKAGAGMLLYKINTDNFKKIEVITEHGWKIFFNPDTDLDQQCENLYSLMQKTFKEAEPKEYIDLRYGNKVYYK
ncbi:MAG: hypothetical protein V1688_04655 [bacterium]